MLLNYFSLSKIFVVMMMCFIFLKIYQHNLVIKLNYERQRLEKQKIQFEKKKNDLCVELATLLEPEKMLTKAKEQWGMKILMASQIRQVQAIVSDGLLQSHRGDIDVNFLSTTSNDEVLKKIGLYDVVVGNTRR